MRARLNGMVIVLTLLVGGLARGTALGADIRLAGKGTPTCVVVVPPGVLTWEGHDRHIDHWGRIAGCTPAEVETELRKRLQRDSVNDLATYLGKMAGAKVDVVEALAAGDKRAPILIGNAAEKVFGPVGISKAGLYGFRVVADPKRGIGLYGESEYGTSYAIYELLHRLGCRWFMPSELGECIPGQPTLVVPEMDAKLAPATEFRRMEQRTGDADFRRRNRMNGVGAVGGQGGLHISPEEAKRLDASHPDWRVVIDGKPTNWPRWTHPAVAEVIADRYIKRLDEAYVPIIGLAPPDAVIPTEDPEERKHDPEPRVWEPAANQWSVTDRLMILVNRVAERVTAVHPDVRFTVLAYVNHSLPPAREPVHPRVIPEIAPIDFNRHHPMNWPDHPNESWLLDMVRGWGEKASGIAYYAYGMNLAELSAPCPFITKWGTDIPLLAENKLVFWAPETMAGWESMLPGYTLSIRMTFFPQEKPADILADLWPRFYGAAAEPMARYWHRIDRAWIDADEHSGCMFGYLRMFTPEVLAAARADVDEALAKCGTITEYRRVTLVNESLSAFERFMKMREDWAAARMIGLATQYEGWAAAIRSMQDRYRKQVVMGGLTLDYMNGMCAAAYRDGSRLDRELMRLGPALLEWKWKHNPGPEADSLPWTTPDYDDKEWPTTHVVRETWSTIGHHNTMTSGDRSGRMAYRATVNLAAVPTGKKAFLWIGSTDGSAKVFVNGQPVKYVVPEKTRRNEKGDVLDAFSGYCQPAQWDVTGVVKPGANQITILCERSWLNEIGTGGLMGPVVVCREK